jgi:glutathione S-transferase
MAIVFYYSPMSSSTRVHWALEELGVAYDKVKVDLKSGDQKKAAYLALNPNGKVPLCVIDGVPIFESLAILIHLGEAHGVSTGLYPEPGLRRAEALKWMAWSSTTLSEAAVRLLRNTSERFPDDEKNPRAAAAAKSELDGLLGILDGALAGRDYLLGGDFTLADLANAAYIAFLNRLGVDSGHHANVTAWAGRCMARPALGRAMMG